MPPESAPIALGIIGYGNRAVLARVARSLGAEVRTIGDPDALRRSAAAADFPDARIVPTAEEVWTSQVDAVMVLSPDHLHANHAIGALEAGRAVFCEKPLAITTLDADAVLEAAYRTGSRLYVGHNMRHMPVIQTMRGIIESGRIGDVAAVWCRHFVGNGGDYYFKDWHADRSKTTGLLLQKGAHDIDVIHWLARGYTRSTSAIGALRVYDTITDRRSRHGETVGEWTSVDNWPPRTQTGLHPVIDVEDLSMMLMTLDNGVLASYQQCHFTPDYWRNYTVIGTEGRIENIGDAEGAVVAVWDTRTEVYGEPDERIAVTTPAGGHGGADPVLLAEFLRFARHGGATLTSPVAAREAVATAYEATASIRSGGGARAVPPVPEDIERYFADGQTRIPPGAPE